MGIVNWVKVTDPSRLSLPRHASGSSGTSPVHHAAWSPSDVTPLTALPTIARWVSCFLPAFSNVLRLSLREHAHGRAPERGACIIDGMLPLPHRGCFVPCFYLEVEHVVPNFWWIQERCFMRTRSSFSQPGTSELNSHVNWNNFKTFGGKKNKSDGFKHV